MFAATRVGFREQSAPPTVRPLVTTAADVSCESIIAGVAGLLEHFVGLAEKVELATATTPKVLTSPFESTPAEQLVPIAEYLYHLARAGLCSKECFIIALVYGERLLQRHENFLISRRVVHRLVLTSLLVASKVLDDFSCRNTYYAQAGGISTKQMNELELELIFLLDFDLQVQPEEFTVYQESLRRESPLSPAGSPTSPTYLAPIPSNMQLLPQAQPVHIVHVSLPRSMPVTTPQKQIPVTAMPPAPLKPVVLQQQYEMCRASWPLQRPDWLQPAVSVPSQTATAGAQNWDSYQPHASNHELGTFAGGIILQPVPVPIGWRSY